MLSVKEKNTVDYSMEKKQFYNYVIPSILAMVVTGLYFVVDGIFIGRGVGTEAFSTSVSMMLTMGGATLASISLGKGDIAEGNKSFNTTIWVILFFAIFISLVGVLFPEAIARILGASDLLTEGASTYIRYYSLFGMFFCGSMTLSAFVRNDGNPKLASVGMIVGAISNVFLDWLFIFPFGLGIMGAALASGLGQLLSCLVLSIHFFRGKGVFKVKKPKIDKNLLKQIAIVGFPEFVTQMSQPITTLCYNYVVLSTLGEIGVSAYAVISYSMVVVGAVFIGLAQGLQPLISRSLGEGKRELERYFLKKGLRLNVFLSIIVYLIMLFFGKNIFAIFNTDPTLIELAYNGIVIYGISFIFASVNIVYVTYFLATKRTKQAITITFLRGFIINVICIVLFPLIFGINALWTGMIFTEMFVMFVALWLGKEKIKICLTKQILQRNICFVGKM